MSQILSPVTQQSYGLQRICKVWGISRATLHRHFKAKNKPSVKRGREPTVEQDLVLESIRADLARSPFRGEGHRKVHARLKRAGMRVGRNRVLSIMRENQLLSPHRSKYRSPSPHDSRITTDAPKEMWGSDGTKLQTVEEGWVWVFSVMEHWNSECMGWHVCKTGDRFAALEPVTQAIRKTYQSLGKDVARGLKLRIDNGSQYTSDYFLQQLGHWGVESSFGLVRQPETNGVAERFHRTLKEQLLDGRSFRNVDEVREAVGQFVRVYNEEWLVAKRGYQSPIQARCEYNRVMGAA